MLQEGGSTSPHGCIHALPGFWRVLVARVPRNTDAILPAELLGDALADMSGRYGTG